MPRTRSAQALADGPQPKHAQLSETLADLVVRELEPDEAIPSERDLMATYGVSRTTVRKAIESLILDGVLHRVHGKGTFVARPRLESRLHLASFTQDMRRRGLTPSTVLLGVTTERPPTDIAGALELGPDEVAWRIDRIRLADLQPIAVEKGWYSQPLLPGLDRLDLSDSLYSLFASNYGLVVDSAEQTLWGESADTLTARQLDAPLHTPLLVFRRLSRSGGRPLEYVVSRYRGDRYQIHMSLDRNAFGSTNPPPTGEGNPQ